jgi:hypothetical protein
MGQTTKPGCLSDYTRAHACASHLKHKRNMRFECLRSYSSNIVEASKRSWHTNGRGYMSNVQDLVDHIRWSGTGKKYHCHLLLKFNIISVLLHGTAR